MAEPTARTPDAGQNPEPRAPENAGQNPEPQVEPKAESAPASDGQQSSETKDWREELDEPLRASKSLAKFADRNALAKGYIELEAQLGKLSRQKPSAQPEEPRPEKAEEYKLDPIEGFEPPETYVPQMQGIFHEAGLTQAQANALHQAIVKNAMENQKAFMEAQTAEEKKAAEAKVRQREEGVQLLRSAWGLNFDHRLSQAQRFVAEEGGPTALDHLEKLGVADDPVLLQLFAKAGAAIGPHRLVAGSTPKGQALHPYAYMNAKSG